MTRRWRRGWPVHTHGGIVRDLDMVQTWPDGWALTEWLAGAPATVVRYRTELAVPVPFAPGDWQQFAAMLEATS